MTLPHLPPKPLLEIMEDVKAQRARIVEMAARMVAQNEPLRGFRSDQWVLIAPDTLDPARWRMTRFEGDTPCNHVGPTSAFEAINSALDYVPIESLSPIPA